MGFVTCTAARFAPFLGHYGTPPAGGKGSRRPKLRVDRSRYDLDPFILNITTDPLFSRVGLGGPGRRAERDHRVHRLSTYNGWLLDNQSSAKLIHRSQ